ncbi:MAG: hypothetical protein M1355_02935 [Patescibacteria group bacterium]|nr:hypothetical protein [Patescibacteria group bacterium]
MKVLIATIFIFTGDFLLKVGIPLVAVATRKEKILERRGERGLLIAKIAIGLLVAAFALEIYIQSFYDPYIELFVIANLLVVGWLVFQPKQKKLEK